MSRAVRLAVAIAITAGCAVNQRPAPTGARGSVLVGATATAWWYNGGDDGGFGEGVQVACAVRPHLLLGGRITGLATLHLSLFGEGGELEGRLVDIGPTIGTGGRLGRLSATLSAAPLLTYVKHREDGADRWTTTAGLGVDAGLAVRIRGPFALGVHGFENINPAASVTGIGLRFEASYFP